MHINLKKIKININLFSMSNKFYFRINPSSYVPMHILFWRFIVTIYVPDRWQGIPLSKEQHDFLVGGE